MGRIAKQKRFFKTVHHYVWHDLAIALVILLPLVAAVYALISSRTFQLGGDLVRSVETSQKVVALTFDDGPEPPYSDQLLSILKDKGVKATFFLIGQEMQRHPAATQRLIDSGNQIGNHTLTHDGLAFVSPSYIAWQIESTDRIIRNHGYDGTIPFRPPYGMKLIWLPQYLQQHDRPNIMWTVVADDNNAAQATRQIRHRVLSQLKPGMIIDMHAMYAHNKPVRDVLPRLIDDIKAAGYRFVTVDQLLTYSHGHKSND
ncbi:MAG TPA: polysaccharide deacetylase family protein [Candidatus Saccharimonadales bacterium]|nr:polysaccharide deacetylase family protein [Candidatus Saccharimonadales bacterium]